VNDQVAYLAEDAAELVEVDYECLDPVIDYQTAAASGEKVHPDRACERRDVHGRPARR
jgi:CO/xanthine dehydrogenase Mo-binding subunit